MFESVTGIVLQKEFRGECGVLFKVFSKAEGIVALYKRVSQKKAASLPDYFDEVHFDVQRAKNGNMLFASEYEILVRRTELAKRYEAYECAAKLALCCARNGAYLENFERLYKCFEAALNALISGADPAVCELKFMYLFARDEGYAIKEDFFANLDAEGRNLFKQILLSPAKDSDAFASGSRLLLVEMLTWISLNTDILV